MWRSVTDGHGRVAGNKEDRKISLAAGEDGRDMVQLAMEGNVEGRLLYGCQVRTGRAMEMAVRLGSV